MTCQTRRNATQSARARADIAPLELVAGLGVFALVALFQVLERFELIPLHRCVRNKPQGENQCES